MLYSDTVIPTKAAAKKEICEGKINQANSAPICRATYLLSVRSAEEIDLILFADLEKAMAELNACAKHFGQATKELSSGCRGSDGSLALRVVGDRRRRALIALQEALKRHTAFILHGVIPEDLQD